MAGLSERGVGVAVPIVQGRELVGLWVLAQPPQGPGLHRRRAGDPGPALPADRPAPGRCPGRRDPRRRNIDPGLNSLRSLERGAPRLFGRGRTGCPATPTSSWDCALSVATPTPSSCASSRPAGRQRRSCWGHLPRGCSLTRRPCRPPVRARPGGVRGRPRERLFADPRLREGLARARGRARGPGRRCACACAWTPGRPACTAWPGRRCRTRRPAAAGRFLFTSERVAALPLPGRPDLTASGAAPAAPCGRWSPSPAPPTWPLRPGPGRRAGGGGPAAGGAGRDAATVLGVRWGSRRRLARLGRRPCGRRRTCCTWCATARCAARRTAGWPGRGVPLAGAGGRAPSGWRGTTWCGPSPDLPRRPLLVVLASCQSAGRTHRPGALAAVGPRLAGAGVGAVVAMQDRLTLATAERLLPAFFAELRRDGQVDRALAAARLAVRERPDWWAPVLFLRLRDGRLWAEPRGRRGSVALRGRAGPAQPPADAGPRAPDLGSRGCWSIAARGRPAGAAAWRSARTPCPTAGGCVVQEAPARRPGRSRRGRRWRRCSTPSTGSCCCWGSRGRARRPCCWSWPATLLDRAERDGALPIPVVFPLSPGRRAAGRWKPGWWGSWACATTSPAAVAAAWVAEEQVLPLLDGLDEVRGRAAGGLRRGRSTPSATSRARGWPAWPSAAGRPSTRRWAPGWGCAGAVLLQPLAPAQVERLPGSGGAQLGRPAGGPAGGRRPAGAGHVPAPAEPDGAGLPGRPGGGAAGRRTRRGSDARALFAAYVERMFARRRGRPALPAGADGTLAGLAGGGDDPPGADRLLSRAAAAGVALLTGGALALHARRPARLRARPGRPRGRRRGPGRGPPGLVLAGAGGRGLSGATLRRSRLRPPGGGASRGSSASNGSAALRTGWCACRSGTSSAEASWAGSGWVSWPGPCWAWRRRPPGGRWAGRSSSCWCRAGSRTRWPPGWCEGPEGPCSSGWGVASSSAWRAGWPVG